jgi:glycosyltransferase involved in cell wall biosynthesis
MKSKLVRITTVPISLDKLIEGQMKFMTSHSFEVVGISSPGDLLEKVGNKEGVKVKGINMSRKITPIQDLIAVLKLYKFLKKEKPFIVHTHTPKAGIVGMLASYFAKVPYRLHTVAGLPLLEATGLKRKVLNAVEKITYNCATNVYPNSYGLKNIILDNRFANKEKLKVIGNGSSNGIDTSYFDPKLFSINDKEDLKTNLGIKNTDFVFIFVGRIVSDKGINELVVSFEKLSIKNKNIKLLLVGPFEEKLDPLKEKTKLIMKHNKQIISVGYQKDVRPYFAIANALTFPSYREGFPNVVMQAGAMELPSIVSDINGCNEIIDNNVNGKLIKLKSVSAIYDAMLEMYTDKQLYNLIKGKTRDLIKQRYERKLFWDLLLSEYNYLLNKK